LAVKTVHVDEINFKIQKTLPDKLISFKSINTVTDKNEIVDYTTKFLNSLDFPRFSPHNLRLKIGSPIVFIRNISALRLCNVTRLVIKKIL